MLQVWVNKSYTIFNMENTSKTENEISVKIQKGIDFLSKLSKKQRDKLLGLLKRVHEIQKTSLSRMDKVKKLKNIMWTRQSVKSKLLLGAFFGAISGLFIFSTGGIGITALGGGVGVWGWLASSVGGVAISSLIQNFEKDDKN